MDLVISPLKIELAGLIKRSAAVKVFSKKKLKIYMLPGKANKTMIAVTGMGKDSSINSLKEIKRYIDNMDIAKDEDLRIISTGFCGSLSDKIKAGDLVYYKKIINLAEKFDDQKTGHPTGGPVLLSEIKSHSLLNGIISSGLKEVTAATVPEVVGNSSKKKRLREDLGCDVIDMESYWIAKNIPEVPELIFLRAVSDDTDADFPEGRFIALKIALSIFEIKKKCNFLSLLKKIKKAQGSITKFLEEVIDL